MREFLILFKFELREIFAFREGKRKFDLLGSLLSLIITGLILAVVGVVLFAIVDSFVAIKFNKVSDPVARASEILNLIYTVVIIALSWLSLVSMRKRLVNFSGNQCGLNHHLDLTGCPENLLYRIAYGFAAGNLLSLVLKEQGKLHWGWGLPWSDPEPNQESALELIANLNAIRKKYPEFLLCGRMEKLSVPFECGESFILRKNGEKITVPEVLAVEWTAPDGKRAVVLTNYHNRKSVCSFNGKTIELKALDAVVINI